MPQFPRELRPSSVFNYLHRLNLTVSEQEVTQLYEMIKFRVMSHGGHRQPKKCPLYLNLYEIRMLIFASSISTFFQNVLNYYVLNFTISVFQYAFLYKFTNYYLNLLGRSELSVNSVLHYSQADMKNTKVLKMKQNRIYLFGLPILKLDHNNCIYLVKYLKKDQIYLGIGRGRSGIPSYNSPSLFLDKNFELKPVYIYDVKLYFIANEILFFKVNQLDPLHSEEEKAQYNPPATHPLGSKHAGKPLKPEERTQLKITRLVTDSQLYEAGLVVLSQTLNTHCPECFAPVQKPFGRNTSLITLKVNGETLVGKYHNYCLDKIKTRAQEDEPGHNRTLSLLL